MALKMRWLDGDEHRNKKIIIALLMVSIIGFCGGVLLWQSMTGFVTGSFTHYDIQTLVQNSTDIVKGVILNSQTHKYVASDGGYYLYTIHTFQVQKAYNGNLAEGQQIFIRQFGGKDILLGEMVSLDNPLYRVKDTLILFLFEVNNTYYTLGMSQGSFYIINEKIYGTSDIYPNAIASKHLMTGGISELEFLQNYITPYLLH